MKVQVINNSTNPLPKYETKYSAGVDVRADFSRVNSENPIKVFGAASWEGECKILTLSPGSRALIPTGLRVAIPEGYEIQVRPRSGLSLKEGIVVILGTIDSDYRQEVGLIIINQGLSAVSIEHGERLGQFVLNKVEQIEWELVETLSETGRKGGFGSTGKN